MVVGDAVRFFSHVDDNPLFPKFSRVMMVEVGGSYLVVGNCATVRMSAKALRDSGVRLCTITPFYLVCLQGPSPSHPHLYH